MTWTFVALSIFGGPLCLLVWAVLHGYRINAQLDELIEERKADREEARRIAREHEELRHAAE